ncbi:transporter substrate-binding protein [Lentisphaera marina]|uniref:transporter substrate-binding protein n=1 Tax=Lentisphaera marina TaxID=1111041 RepID=UPI002365C36E|nr:transporter substrate-binding protein [Lentisphaera marina]MDD7986123.1 transporter substrate-binding protein [Lentisphaera marina]
MDFDGRVILKGETIKALRLKQCLSRDMFSSKSQEMGCYLSVSTLKRAEAGNKIYYRTAQDIASILKVSIDELKNSSLSSTNPDKKTPPLSRDEQIHRACSSIFRVKDEKRGSVIFVQGEPGIGKTHFISKLIGYAEKYNFINFTLPIYDGVTSKRQLLQDLVREFIEIINSKHAANSHYPQCTNLNYSQNSMRIYPDCLEYFSLNTGLDKKTKKTLFTLFGQNTDIDKSRKYKETIINEIELVFTLIKQIDRPINIVLEDIHWASSEIISTIQSFTHEIRLYPLILTLSSRLIQSPLYQIWNNTVLNTPLELFNLSPLNKHELIKVGSNTLSVPSAVQDKYIKLSNGNPLFFRYLLDMGFKYKDNSLPQSLTSLVRQQLSKLDEQAVNFLFYASALGHEFKLSDVEQISQIANLDLSKLIQYNFFISKDSSNYEFKHDLIRQSIYQNIPEEIKIEIHESAASFYKELDQAKLTLHLRKANQTQKALHEIKKHARILYEKQDYCEALNQIDIALALPDNSQLYALYYMKGVLLKMLDLPAKATQYLEKALHTTELSENKLQIYMELTEIYAVNQRFELSFNYLTKAKELVTDTLSPEDKNSIDKYQFYLKQCTHSLNTVPKQINYQESKAFKTSIQNFNEVKRPDTKSTLEKQHKVAFLHSASGILKEHEEGVIKSYIVAFDEINKNGGLLDHKITYEIFDGQSNEYVFAEQAKNIVKNHNITSVFGCSTSSTRKQVKPIIEQSNKLLIYPFHYEGLESSKNIIYTGPTSNLQALPIIDWLFDKIKPHSFYFVGSDYIYPVVTNEILKEAITVHDSVLLGEDYLAIGSTDFHRCIEQIQDKKPEVIILTLASVESNKAFLKQYHESNMNQNNNTIIISLVLSDNEINHIPLEHCEGLYGIFTYFQNNDEYSNNDFLQEFKLKYGKQQRVAGYMESAYVGVQLWAKAIQKCQSFEAHKIAEAIKGLSYYGPGGIAYIDEDNQHIWRHSHIAQVGKDGLFHILWSSDQPIAPTPYPLSRSKEDWSRFLESSKTRWNGGWGI